MDEIAKLWVEYACADGPAKSAAWLALVRYLVANPNAARLLYSSAGAVFDYATVVALRAAVIRALVQRRALQQLGGELVASSISTRFVTMRLAAALGAMPKIPVPPQGQMMIALAVVIGTTGQAFAEGRRRQDKAEAYQNYVVEYLIKVLKVAAIHPDRVERLVPPQTFDEWYLENP